MTHVKFEVGRKYENMKGADEVLSIDQNTMLIRWDSGEGITTTMSLQRKIIMRMREEQRKREEA